MCETLKYKYTVKSARTFYEVKTPSHWNNRIVKKKTLASRALREAVTAGFYQHLSSIFQSLDCTQEDCRPAANSIITDNHFIKVTKWGGQSNLIPHDVESFSSVSTCKNMINRFEEELAPVPQRTSVNNKRLCCFWKPFIRLLGLANCCCLFCSACSMTSLTSPKKIIVCDI